MENPPKLRVKNTMEETPGNYGEFPETLRVGRDRFLNENRKNSFGVVVLNVEE